MTRPRSALLLLIASFLIGVPTSAIAGNEISVFGSHSAGDYGTGIDSDSQAFTMRFVTGDVLQFRIDAPVLRAQSSYGTLQTGFGSTPTGERHRGGPAGAGSPGHGGAKAEAQVPEGTQWNTGLGDIRLSASRRLAGGGVRLFRFDIMLELKLPTADEDLNLGTGEFDARLALHGSYRFWSATGFADIGYSRLGDPDWIELQDVAELHLGVESDPLAAGRLTLTGWVEGRDEVVAGTGSHAAVGFAVSTTGRLRWRGALVAGLGSASQDYSVVVGVSYGISRESWNKGLYR